MHSSSLARLPNELLDLILSFIGTEAPSVRNISREPSVEFTTSDDRDLKNFSLVCRRLRESALPDLFKYARLRLGIEMGWGTRLHCFNPSAARLLPELDETEAGHEDEEIEEVESGNARKRGSPSVERRRIRQGTNEPLRFDRSAFREMFAENRFNEHVASLVIYATKLPLEEALNDPLFDLRCSDEDPGIVCALWKDVFSILNPSRLVLLAPPVVLAFLAGETMSPLRDGWAYEIPYHLLELRQDDVACQTKGKSTILFYYRSIYQGPQSCLVLRRPWNYLLINEGSHVNVYSTYQYYSKTPPSIAHKLLKKFLYLNSAECQCVFNYIAVFPTCDHVASVLEDLMLSPADNSHLDCSSISSLHLRLAPHPLDKIMEDPTRLGKADLSDCWTELNAAYSMAASWVRKHGDVFNLTRFCSGDYDIEALRPALDDKLKDQGWSQCGSGTWIKDDNRDMPVR